MVNIKNENFTHKTLEEINQILMGKTLSFFPKSGEWGSTCFRKSENVEYYYLPCHLRDNQWLANLLLKESNLSNKYYNVVLYFVENSKLFQKKRHEYELEIVRWQINFIKNGGENWICDENFGGDITFLTPMCDLGFRKGVVDTLTAIGMNKEVIEEGLEKYADLWRDRFINQAFRNEYEPILYNLFSSKGTKKIPPVNPKHKEAWIKMRLYEYYCNHKKSVDLYGSITPEMKITAEEAYELKRYLDVENTKRKTLINIIIYGDRTNLYIDNNTQKKSKEPTYFRKFNKWLNKISKRT